MREPLALGSVQDIRSEVGKRTGDPMNVFGYPLRRQLQLRRELRPLTKTDLAKPVLASDPHRELQLLDRGLAVGESARDVVEGRKPNPALKTVEVVRALPGSRFSFSIDPSHSRSFS